jgi:phosphatidylglycerophosphate synthase
VFIYGGRRFDDRRRRSEAEIGRLGLGLVLTIMRIPVAAGLLATISVHRWVALVLLVMFVLVDIADGWVARRTHANSDFRRLLDGVIDRVTMCVALVVGASHYARIALPFILAICARESVLGARNCVIYFSTRRVFAGRPLHKAQSLACAFLGAAILSRNATVSYALGFVCAVSSLVLALPYVNDQEMCIQSAGLGVSPRRRLSA